MVMKDGKAWAKTWDDGHSTDYGFVNIEDGTIHNPEYCLKSTDVTYPGSPYEKILKTAKLVSVKRTTTVEIQ